MSEAIATWDQRQRSSKYVRSAESCMLDEIADLRAALARRATPERSEGTPAGNAALNTLLTRIDDAYENYERFGEVCSFEGEPMIYASTLSEIVEFRGNLHAAPERCPHCDGTGDVHRPDGEWMGTCLCPAGVAADLASNAATAAPELDPIAETLIRAGHTESEAVQMAADSRARLAAPAAPAAPDGYISPEGRERVLRARAERQAATAAPGNAEILRTALLAAREMVGHPDNVAAIDKALADATAAPGDLTGQDIAAAERQAALYEDDDRECIKTDVMNAVYAGIAYERQRASNAGAAPGWIAVVEQMPPKDVEVLVYLPSADPRVQMDTWGELYEAPVSFSSQTICTGEGWSINEFEDITHWMPIPTAPSNPPVGAKEQTK